MQFSWLCGNVLPLACAPLALISDSQSLLTCIFGLLFSFVMLLWTLVIGFFVGYLSLAEYIIFLSLPVAFFFVSTDVWQLENNNFLHRYLVYTINFVSYVLNISVACLSAFGVMFVLRSAAVGVIMFLQLAATYVLYEGNLPFVTFCVLVCCYLLCSYRSFTQKYQDLAVRLFEQYDEITNSVHNRPLNRHGTTNNAKRIPKELFDRTCKEMMPIRKSISSMMVKATLSVIFVFLVFSLTVSMNTSSEVKSLVLFLTGSFPMITDTIFLHKRRQNNCEEKTREIVQEYMNSRFNCNREQLNYGARFQLDVSKGKNSISKVFLAYVVPCFISFVLSLSFSIFRSLPTLCLVMVLSKSNHPHNLSEISQLVYRYPLPTNELYKVCDSW